MATEQTDPGESVERFFTDREGMGVTYGLIANGVIIECWAPHLGPVALADNHRELAERAADRGSGNCVHLDDWGARLTDKCSRCSARRLLAAASDSGRDEDKP